MNNKALLFISLLLCIPLDPLVPHKPSFDENFLIPGNIRITNDLTMGRYADQVERLYKSFMRKWDIRGASVAIAVEGRLIFARGFGYSNTEELILAEPYHKFRIASVSKLITAVAIMKLCEEGKMTVDDNVFGPKGILNDSLFLSIKDRRFERITVAQLLGHQGGWTARYGDHMFITQSVAKQLDDVLPLTTEDYVRFALTKNLHFNPGSGRSYSNLGYAILGLVIEKVSGLDYEQFCRKEIFEPLGIYDVALGRNLESESLPNEVRYYEHASAIPKPSVYGTGELVPARYGGNDIESLGGAGAWVATASDLLKFMLAIDGLDFNPDILLESTIRQMTDSNSKYAPLGWKSAFGNGIWWRTGFFPGTTAMMKRYPGGLSWVVLLNSSAWNGPELTNDINYLMNRVTSLAKEWPDYDLFKYSLPVPLKYDLNKQEE